MISNLGQIYTAVIQVYIIYSVIQVTHTHMPSLPIIIGLSHEKEAVQLIYGMYIVCS